MAATKSAPIVKTYHSEKSGREVAYIPVAEGQYPWNLYSQECLRVIGVLKTVGPEGIVVLLQSFVDGERCEPTDLYGYSEYQGHSLIQFRAAKGDRGMQFGAGKAKALLALIAKVGYSAILAACVEVAGDAKPATGGKPAKGKGKGKAKGEPAKGGGRQPEPADDVEAEDEAEATVPMVAATDDVMALMVQLARAMATVKSLRDRIVALQTA